VPGVACLYDARVSVWGSVAPLRQVRASPPGPLDSVESRRGNPHPRPDRDAGPGGAHRRRSASAGRRGGGGVRAGGGRGCCGGVVVIRRRRAVGVGRLTAPRGAMPMQPQALARGVRPPAGPRARRG